MSTDTGPEGEPRAAEQTPGDEGSGPRASGQSPDAARRAAAGALVGIAMGGFLVALLAHIHVRVGWSVGAYEPAAALLGALGAWWFGAQRGARDVWLAMGAALAAMLLGDFFWTLAHTPHGAWWQAAGRMFAELGWRGSDGPLADWTVWPKFLRYGFGLYIGWYVGSAIGGPTRRCEGKKGGR